MWIVHVALRRPYTFICGAILVLIAGLVAIMTTPVDIFPAIPLPVATVIWQYQGMSPAEMEQRVVTIVERSYSATVNDIEHIESQSLDGVAVIKVFFQPTADVATGIAELTAASQSNTRILPPGITPPIILRFNATDVPILQIGVGSSTMSQANLNDYVSNFVRTPLATAQGSTIPFPYGGDQDRQPLGPRRGQPRGGPARGRQARAAGVARHSAARGSVAVRAGLDLGGHP